MARQRAWRREKGFTLVELIVVIAILGVLAAIAVPTISNFLGSSKEQAYNTERETIQAAVEAYYGSPDNEKYNGKRQYPILGHDDNSDIDSTDDSNAGEPDGTTVSSTDKFIDDRHMMSGTTTVTGLAEAVWNGVGGTQGADLSNVWNDTDNDGVRPADATEDNWDSVSVTRGGKTYYVDPRYFFIDFELLVSEGLLESVPSSTAPDNDQDGVGSPSPKTGSYIWYVDDEGKVQSLYVEKPDEEGFQDDVYP